MSQTAVIGEPITWVSTGTSDTLDCYTHDLGHYGGYQIDADGFNVEAATIVVHTRSGAQKTVAPVASTGESGLVAEGFGVSRIVISNIAAGSYPVTISKASKLRR